MKPFKGSSNKLGLLGFQLASRYRNPPVEWHNSITAVHIIVEVVLYPIRQAILTPIKVTTNKLEKVLILS